MEYAECPHCQKSFRPHGLKIHISKMHGIHRPLPTRPSISTSLPSPPPSPEMALLKMQLKLELVKLQNQEKQLEKAREDWQLQEKKLREDMERRDKELELRAKELDLQDKKAREDREHDALQREKDRQHQYLMQREMLDEMDHMHQRESKCVEQYQKKLLAYQNYHNQSFGRLFYDPPGTSFTSYSNDEFLLYGTTGEPYIQTADLIQYIGNNVFKCGTTVFGLASKIVMTMAIQMTTGDVRKITRPYRSFCPTFPDSETPSFVPLRQWDDVSHYLEKAIDVDQSTVKKKLKQMCTHYPFSGLYGYLPYSDPNKNDDDDDNTTVVSDVSVLTTEDDDSTDEDDETMTKKWTVDMPPPRMPLDDMSTKYLDKGKDGIVRVKDDKWGEHRSLPPDRNIGDDVNEFKIVRGQCDKLIHTMKGAMSKNQMLKQIWTEKLAKNRARIHITRQRLKNTGYCMSDMLDRYYQDQQKQSLNREVDFDKRDNNKRDNHQEFRNHVWKTYFRESTKGRCEACNTEITQKTFTIGHIVPSKQGKVGSNEDSNVRPLCYTCNQKNGSQDSIVWEKSEKGEMLVKMR